MSQVLFLGGPLHGRIRQRPESTDFRYANPVVVTPGPSSDDLSPRMEMEYALYVPQKMMFFGRVIEVWVPEHSDTDDLNEWGWEWFTSSVTRLLYSIGR